MISVCFLFFYLDTVFAYICTFKYSREMWPTDHWDWQMLSPSISFLLLLYNLVSLLSAEYVIGTHAWKEGKHIAVAFLPFSGFISAVSMTAQKVTNLKNCLHINLPFGADKILHFREDYLFSELFLFPCVSVCVASVTGSLPTSSLVCSLLYVMSQCFQNRGFQGTAGTITSKWARAS